MRAAKAAGLVAAAHDLGDGGLALAAAEMALAGGDRRRDLRRAGDGRGGWFFGEDQGRYLVAAAAEDSDRLLVMALETGVPLKVVGGAGGAAVRLGEAAVPLASLRAAHDGGLPRLLD